MGFFLFAGGHGVAQVDHFHDKGKLLSKYSIEKQQRLRKTLPFADKQDFEEQTKGFIAAPDYKQIMADAGHVAWDMGKYEFLLKGEDFDSIHPSLQRQAVLNMNYGLYEVIPGIYQVRGYDLANSSFIQGDTGWIVFDPLTVKETAAAALKFINGQLGERPVVAVVYSHSHADDFGGVRGVVDEADGRSGKVKVIAPVGFMDHAVSENVYAGNAMSRLVFYLHKVNRGLALGLSAGSYLEFGFDFDDDWAGRYNVVKGEFDRNARWRLRTPGFATRIYSGSKSYATNHPTARVSPYKRPGT